MGATWDYVEIVGLQNLGNTCFMNAGLQCLFSTPRLVDYFLKSTHREELNTSTSLKGRLATVFGELVQRMRRQSRMAVENPSELKRVVERLAPQFSGYNQHDSQEFIRFLLDGLHEDLNRVKKKPPYEELKDEEGETDSDRSEKWWRYYMGRSDSFVFDLFGGQLMSVVTCGTCRHRSTAFDTFMDLSLPIPRNASAGSRVSLYDCLTEFTEEEVLDGDEKVYCSKCKQHRRSSKKLTIWRFPPILVVHLKRFSFNSWRRDKLNTNVSFPAMDLQLRRFAGGSDDVSAQAPVYDLYAVTHHVGGLGGGHYTAHAMYHDRWYSFNDSHVREVGDASAISGSSAYVLFYKRQGH
eukprot:GILI01011871.1.p1 GENE.GILI01011871.1~~GILI01011871.1.p1  ORF type:complete len:407 (+),score=50.07 GILI01011871.1:167-1222(+)